MRFLSSSALAKADQLILAASCSAADAMADLLRAALQERRAPSYIVSLPPAEADFGGNGPSIWSPRRPMPTLRRSNSGSGGRSLVFAQRLEGAASFLDCRRSALGRDLDLEIGLGLQFAHAKNLDP